MHCRIRNNLEQSQLTTNDMPTETIFTFAISNQCQWYLTLAIIVDTDHIVSNCDHITQLQKDLFTKQDIVNAYQQWHPSIIINGIMQE